MQMMNKMKGQKEVRHLFTASVVDLYMFGFYDLLNERKMISLPGMGDRKLTGYKEVKLLTPEDVKYVILTAMNNRVSSGTKCN